MPPKDPDTQNTRKHFTADDTAEESYASKITAASAALFSEYLSIITKPIEKTGVLARDSAAPVAPAAPAKPIDEQASAAEYQRKGERLLAASIKDLKFTTDGSLPLIRKFQAESQLSEDISIEKLAKKVLGNTASKEQIKCYVDCFIQANAASKITDPTKDNGSTKLAKGTTVALPGQTWDGGITFEDGGSKLKVWSNKSSKLEDPYRRQYTTLDGKGGSITVASAPYERAANVEIRSFGNRTEQKDALGTTSEAYKIGDKYYISKQTNKDGSICEFQYGKDKVTLEKITLTSPDKIKTEFGWNDKSGELVSKDGRKGVIWFGEELKQTVETYGRTVDRDGNIAKTFKDRTIVTDSLGTKISEEYLDNLGRRFQQKTKDSLVQEIIYTAPGKDSTPIVLSRTEAGRFESKLFRDGKPYGYVEYTSPDTITYRDDVKNITRTEEASGNVRVLTGLPRGGTKEILKTATLDNITTIIDRHGKVQSRTCVTADGTVMRAGYSADEQMLSFSRAGKDGSKMLLKFDRDLGALEGTARNKDGVIEDVVLRDDLLIYSRRNDGLRRAEKLSWGDQPGEAAGLHRMQFDGDSGKYTSTKDGVIESGPIAGGRSDSRRSGSRALEGKAINGEKSYISDKGEAVVSHADGRRVRLNSDNTIDRWGPTVAETARKESLSAVALKYLRSHPDVDRRDFAEIYRKFASEPLKIDSFFKAMERLDGLSTLKASERSALRTSIIAHVARPAEIFQGSSFCCNVATVQREMAINTPDKYASLLVDCFSKESIKLKDGKSVAVDWRNLKLMDDTGRDIASRAFQTFAVGAAYPDGSFKNTSDGIGLLKNARGGTEAFNGLSPSMIAAVIKRLTGEEKAELLLSKQEDLARIFKENGGKSLIISVDSSKAPFGRGGTGTQDHVVTITGILPGPPQRFLVQNQHGLHSDHSTEATSIESKALWAAMCSGYEKLPASVIASTADGSVDHRKVYDYADGKLTVNEEKTRIAAAEREKCSRRP